MVPVMLWRFISTLLTFTPISMGGFLNFLEECLFRFFCPPLFYWIAATLMKCSGVDATLATKIVITFSFVTLPYALLSLARRLGLSPIEAAVASGFAGLIACSENFAASYTIGLLGLFEKGLYTHILGFIWFCFWCGSLTYWSCRAYPRQQPIPHPAF